MQDQISTQSKNIWEETVACLLMWEGEDSNQERDENSINLEEENDERGGGTQTELHSMLDTLDDELGMLSMFVMQIFYL